MNLLNGYRQSALRKLAMKVNRNAALCAWNNLHKVGIIWHENDIAALNYLLDFFKHRQVIIRHIGWSENKNETNSNVITRKDTNWLGFPKSGTVDTFVQTRFDLLFNLTVAENFALEAITALSVASFKTGWDRNNSGFYDLSVDVSGQPDSLFLAKQQIIYLKQLTKSNV